MMLVHQQLWGEDSCSQELLGTDLKQTWSTPSIIFWMRLSEMLMPMGCLVEIRTKWVLLAMQTALACEQ